ncbi:ABC transporter substrate-binding protein [Paenibacillus marchantiophytorum]|uniref:ABC transporter substrate-binding protein n=1 Tax=Paenibacillus marchantiophytorum TaxID=1619310 RepID=A0ABQ1ETX9_9BACL|nr:ABC transporter substrate-binding protein [Paenibacillus marchantiophytorum]GFZ87284.1 ABC transporter substrate-binding protein [Paenibacillus marchantiophytorum]
MLMKKGSIIASLAVLLVVSGCGAKTAQPSPSQGAQATPQATAAKVSGKLTFYTSQPEDDVTKLIAAFNKKYPDVKVENFRSGTEEVTAKIQAENQAGKVQADVLLLADSVTFEGLKKQSLLASYKSPELAKIPKNLVDPEGMYAGTKVMATVLAINTQKVKTIPTSWKVLSSAESKDAAIMPSPIYSGAAAYNLGVLTRTDGFGWDYYKGLKANNISVVKGNGAVLNAVAAGEKSYSMVVDYLVAREKAKGSAVDLIYPTEGVPVITEPIGIMKNAANEKAAQAFVDFVLSEDGQKLASDIGYTPIREGVPAPKGLKSISELKVISSDITKLTEARDADKKQFTQLFGQ